VASAFFVAQRVVSCLFCFVCSLKLSSLDESTLVELEQLCEVFCFRSRFSVHERSLGTLVLLSVVHSSARRQRVVNLSIDALSENDQFRRIINSIRSLQVQIAPNI
jgi:hypothetical protein